MKPKLSRVGKKMSHLSGVRLIVKDIQEAVQANDKIINAGAGQPNRIPSIENIWHQAYTSVLADPQLKSTIHTYGSDPGIERTHLSIAELMTRFHQHAFSQENIFLSMSTQQLYFNAVMNYCGESDLGYKQLLIPLIPDYTGYNGVVTEKEMITGLPATIRIEGNYFEYTLNSALDEVDYSKIGLMILSCPTNPSGNVLSTADVQKLQERAETVKVPLIIDSAYAPPIPNILFSEYPKIDANLVTDGYTMLGYSLSKSGMAGERFGWAVGNPELLEPLRSFTANTMIHPAKLIQAAVSEVLDPVHDNSEKISSTIQEYYQDKRDHFIRCFESLCSDADIYLHKMQGALFAWLWLPGRDDLELYEYLKSNGVIVVPGRYFFPGMEDTFEDYPQHHTECIRISLSCDKRYISKILETILAFTQ